jgi:outer membrane murein-binding lipoprotein Lpp
MAAIVVLSLVVASLLVAGCTNPTTNVETSPNVSANTTTNTTTTTATATTSKVSASPSQTSIKSRTATPTPQVIIIQATPLPTAQPTLRCNHVTIFVNCPRNEGGGVMCNNGFSLNAGLNERYAGNPYFSSVITNNNGTSGVTGIVQETGETAQFAGYPRFPVEAWVDSHLTCK